MRVLLFGGKVADIERDVMKHPAFEIVYDSPDMVICYGGDGTLLAAERQWPGIPKVPIRNSLRGNRMIAHPAAEVIEHLAREDLVRTEYLKLSCTIRHSDELRARHYVSAMNEVNVHMAKINSAVRFKMWINDEPYQHGAEILGDGFVISTPFGSTAYFNHITRGFFHAGLGIAFKSTSEHTNHVVVPETDAIRIHITRGPAVLTFDNSPDLVDLYEQDELIARKHDHPAVLLTYAPMKYPSDAF